MPPDLHERFKRLLLGLPTWKSEDGRAAILDALRDREIWNDIRFKGSAAEAAANLLALYGQHGPAPFCHLLHSLRQEQGVEVDQLKMELQSRWARQGAWHGPPYLGLVNFGKGDAPIFFGREAEVESLIGTLAAASREKRFTVVLGASGAGKSSLVRAGLWARLAAGQVPELPGSENWLITAMTPLALDSPALSLRAALAESLNEHPAFRPQRGLAASVNNHGSLADVAERLLPPAPQTRWLLILDQMEELFATAADGIAFLDRLLEGATRPSSRLQVLATLRGDFYHHCLQHEPLGRAMAESPGGMMNLYPPGRLALERMVSGPIGEREGWTLDPALPSTMAADAAGRPGGLALMAFALRKLYEHCEPRRHLDLGAYGSEAFGGLGGAIARSAEEALAAAGTDAVLGRVFVHLVRVSGDDEPTRQRARRSLWKADLEAAKLIDAFEKARLLVADRGQANDPVIEVAHEALLREWPRLVRWIHDRRDAFQLVDRVRVEAEAWNGGWRRPWDAEDIGRYREKLVQAGLFDQVKGDAKIVRLLTPEAKWILEELEDRATTHRRRREIGERLNTLGDTRPGVGVVDGVPDILWRPVPGGGEAAVAPFSMAAFPVTHGQFRAFVEAKDGYDHKKWWQDLKRATHDSDWRHGLANHPVTDVSWFDATAFCRWLSARRKEEVRLPNEREWQWAAQSAKAGYAFPWGPDWEDGLANTSESALRGTTAVGMYPHGSSDLKVSDLSGNVWEWCQNKYQEDQESRVLRGGSWSSDRGGARADYRYHGRPGYRVLNPGFRVVCSSPIR